MAEERLIRAEWIYAQALRKIPTGEASRRAPRIRAVSGGLALASAAGFVGFATVGWLPAVAFVTGVVGGASFWVWLLARHAEVRHRVLLRVCDWTRVEQLAERELAELGVQRTPPPSGDASSSSEAEY